MEPVVKRTHGREAAWQSGETSWCVARGGVCVYEHVGSEDMDSWDASSPPSPMKDGTSQGPETCEGGGVPLPPSGQ